MSNKHLNKVFEQGILVDLTVRRWTGQRKLRQEDLGFHGEVSERLISLGRKNLIPPENRAAFRSIESKARYLLENVSFPFPFGNAKFVPESAMPELVEAFKELQVAYREEVTGFVNHYLSIRRKMLAEFKRDMPKIYKITAQNGEYKEFTERFLSALAKLYPEKRDIREKFGFEWHFFEVNLPNFRKRSGRFLAKREEANRELAREYQRHARNELDKFLQDVVGTLRGQTMETCSFVVDKIKSGKIVSEKNLNSLREFIERFEKLNFVGDGEIQTQLADLRKNYLNGHTADLFKDNKALTKQLSAKLTEVTESCADMSDVSAVTGTWKRRIKI